jgi:hypothetical protein
MLLFYQLIIHVCSKADIRNFYFIFFCNFSFSFYFQRGASGRLLLVSEWMWLRRPDGKITRPDEYDLSHAYVATHVRTG